VGSPMQQAYANVAPNPDHWPELVGKLGKLVSTDYDWSESVQTLTTPIMLVVGDADGLSPAHAVEFFELLGGGKQDAGWDGSGMSNSRLAILPGTTHYDIFSSPLLVPAITPFLNAPLPKRN